MAWTAVVGSLMPGESALLTDVGELAQPEADVLGGGALEAGGHGGRRTPGEPVAGIAVERHHRPGLDGRVEQTTVFPVGYHSR